MATQTLQDYYDAVTKRIVDASGGTVTRAAVLDFAHEGLRRLRRGFDLPTGEYVSQIGVMNGVFRYPKPTGYKNYIALMRQGVIKDELNFKRVADPFEFWRDIGGDNKFSEQRNGATRELLINLKNPSLTNSQLHSCDTYNGSGTWAANVASSDATNVATDTLYVRDGSGSISFDIDVSQSVNNYAELAVPDMTAVDLSAPPLLSNALITLEVYLPSSVAFTSFTLRFGSSASDYYEVTVTAPYGGGSFVQGWNQLGFDWRNATTTGSPTTSAIDYLLVRATYAASMTNQTGLRIDNIVARQRLFCDLHYSSDLLIIDSTTGLPKEEFDSVNDTDSYFNCDTAFVDWITYHVLENVFTYYKPNAGKVKLNVTLREELEKDLASQFPSKREIPTKDMIGDDQDMETLMN